MRVPFGVWVVAGVAVGALAAGALVASGALDDEPADRPDPADEAVAVAEQQAADADAFLAAYERSRLGTYVLESTFRRTFPEGNGFTAESTVAQHPPARLERNNGAVTARDGPDITLCRIADGRYRCQTGRAERSYRGLVDDEVDSLASYLDGDVPLYSVTADGDCFDLAQVRPLPAPPYGTAARFCFDEETGAITLLRVERDEAVDLTEATSLTGEVRPRDLRPPETGDRAPEVPEGATANTTPGSDAQDSDGG